MDGMGTADVGAAGLRKTEKSYLPLLDQITDRVGHLLDRHGEIDAVLIGQVNIAGAKPAQGALHRLTNLLRPVITIGAELLVALETKPFRRTHHLIIAG
jgi:hypothetical protein